MSAVDNPGEDPVRRVVVAAFRKKTVERVNDYAAAVCPRGVRLTVIIADGQGWPRARGIDDRVKVLSLKEPENATLFVRTYVLVVERGPRAVLKRLQKRLPGRAGRAAGRLKRLHGKAAKKVRKHVFWRLYRPMRPQLLRRVAARRLAALDLAGVDLVVIADESAVPFGWMIARGFPDLEVTRALDAAVYADLPIIEPIGPRKNEKRSYVRLQ